MEPIESEDELHEWLKDKPEGWAQIIAARVALRILPITISFDNSSDVQRLFLAVFRATALSWFARSYPSYDMQASAEASADAVKFAEDDEAAPLTRYAAIFAARAASSSIISVDAAAYTADSAAYREVNANTVVWDAIRLDCEWLSRQSDASRAPRALSSRSLWLGKPQAHWRKSWADAAHNLLQHDPNFSVWIDWYDRRIRGERAAFDIPGDRGRREDKWLIRQLAEATDKAFWDRGAEYVNRQLIDWLEEARERAARNLKGQDANPKGQILTTKLQAAASPQAAEHEGKLDAGPNREFDQPTYSGDLADLPSAMRSFIKVLLNSLGENASAFMRSSLEGYHEELELRGTQPIVGTLKGLAQAISREIWTVQSLTASDDPEDWAMRDEREWGAGMGDLFRTFAKYNADLITHFPLDKEREELLRETPIDELAASGDALTEPVAMVTGLVRDLHAQGMATDNILKIMDAHAQYNRDIASLPPPPTHLPADYVTAKRRHVLMTAGFYLHLYSVMGSTASLAPAYSTLGTMVWNAAQALLAFVK